MKTNLPRGILSTLYKLCPSLFINSIFLTRGLVLVFFIDIYTGQGGLELPPFYGNG